MLSKHQSSQTRHLDNLSFTLPLELHELPAFRGRWTDYCCHNLTEVNPAGHETSGPTDRELPLAQRD